MPGTLFLVATPLGNLGDITYRAVETLAAATAIVAEDTRRARILCERYGIERPLISMPAFREQDQAGALVSRLARGETLALVTDAGSPGISDPGTALVEKAIAAGIPVVPIPGPRPRCRRISASGLPTDRFFLPGSCRARAPGASRRSRAQRLDATLVLYESPEAAARDAGGPEGGLSATGGRWWRAS
jgi:16S rRNA (cytidine1402-2'-O)-methyltransferase